MIWPGTLQCSKARTGNLEEVETTVGKDWRCRALVLYMVPGLTLAGPVLLAISAETEEYTLSPRTELSPRNDLKLSDDRMRNRVRAKSGGGQSVRSARKNQNRLNPAELKREKTKTRGNGQLSAGKGQINHDFSYHGILERPQRYDPGKHLRNGAVPNPKIRDLRVNHFQELDKNRDGVIDPLERATSRLDIDHDMSNHAWQ